MECLNCQKEITQTPGKRPKKYCSNSCRAIAGNKRNSEGKRKTITISIEHWKEIQDKLKSMDDRGNQFTNAARGRDVSGVNNDGLAIENKIKDAGWIRLEGESSIDFKIRMSELKNK